MSGAGFCLCLLSGRDGVAASRPDVSVRSARELATTEDKGKTRHLFWLVAIIPLAGCSDGAGVAAAGTEEPVLNVYNWSDYIADDTVPEFTRRTGIEVQYDVFDSNEVLETKLLAANTGYDLVVPTASFMERQIKWHYFPMSDNEYQQAMTEIGPAS